jgi:hypothetical protein
VLTGVVIAAMGGASLAEIRQHTRLPLLDAPEPPQVTKPIIGIVTPTPGSWNPLGIVDVDKFPLDATPESANRKLVLGQTTKTFFRSGVYTNPDLPLGNFFRMEYQPTFDTKPVRLGGLSHYHEFFEWGYTLRGDSYMHEPLAPFNRNGVMFHKKEGGWLDRPPYSLHSGSFTTGGLREQAPYDLLLFEEGDGHTISVGPAPGEPGRYGSREGQGKGPPPGVTGDWRKVKQFARPWLVNSNEDMDWEDDVEMPGRFVKWLSDDMANGFRAQLVKIPPGWTPPADMMKTYFENANRLRYMVWGNMKVWQFSGPTDAGKAYKVGEEYFIYQPPRGIWGYGPGPVTNEGAIWLEITYAKGFTHAGAGPIEAVKKLN